MSAVFRGAALIRGGGRLLEGGTYSGLIVNDAAPIRGSKVTSFHTHGFWLR